MAFKDYLHGLWHLLHPGAADVRIVNDLTVQRQMLYDAFSDGRAMADLLDMPALSDDVHAMEMQAHQDRLERIVPLFPLLLQQSVWMAQANAALQIQIATSPWDSDEQIQLLESLTNIIKASVVSTVSTAVDLGALHVPKEVSL